VGLKNCAELVKRAIQFGTRIAQQTNVMHVRVMQHDIITCDACRILNTIVCTDAQAWQQQEG